MEPYERTKQEEMVEDGKYERCWACDTLCFRKWRIEYHHVFGKSEEKMVPLCVTCHDYIDRMNMDHSIVFFEFLRMFEEIESLPRGKTKYLRLFTLKLAKNVKDFKLGGNNVKIDDI